MAATLPSTQVQRGHEHIGMGLKLHAGPSSAKLHVQSLVSTSQYSNHQASIEQVRAT